MTFTCPHLRVEDDTCLLLRTDCVPGRPGCVLQRAGSAFATPVEERIRLAAEARRRREWERLRGGGGGGSGTIRS